MPIDSGLKTLLTSVLHDHQLKTAESDQILKYVKTHADKAGMVGQVVDSLRAAVLALGTESLELNSSAKRQRLVSLLGQLDKVSALPLDKEKAKRPDGSIDWIAALKLQTGPPPPPPPPAGGLPLPSFDGSALAVGADGKLSLQNKPIALDLANADAGQLSALLALARPGQAASLNAAQKTALGDALLAQVDAVYPLVKEDPNRLKKGAAAAAALSTISDLGASLSAAQIDALIALLPDAPNALAKGLITRGLNAATLSAEQKTKANLPSPQPEAETALVASYQSLLKEGQSVDSGAIKGAVSETALSLLAFARDASAATNALNVLNLYAPLNTKGNEVWDAEERGFLSKFAEAYVNKYPQLDFGFGLMASEAVQDLAKITNARLLPSMTADLAKNPPEFGGVPLSADQTASITKLFSGIKDPAAQKAVAQALAEAADLFSAAPHAPWSDPAKPKKALGAPEFAAFDRTAARFIEGRDGTKDGMIDAAGLLSAVKDEVKLIQGELTPRMKSLAASPPSFDGVKLSPEAAAEVRSILASSLKSEMSPGNLGGALKVIADANGGSVNAAGLTQLKKLIADYKANFPGAQLFDFNKLGRMASFLVQGKTMPLSTLNGQAVPLAEYYVRVGSEVSKALDASKLRYPWMADRFGLRAKESAELLDVIAQQTAEGKGPVIALEQQFPGKKVRIEVTALPGAHEQFIYSVEGAGRFAQGSDGKLAAYAGPQDAAMMTATVSHDGSFDVQVKKPLSLSNWPAQTTYAVGDIVDIRYLDPTASEVLTEGKPFSSDHKILKGKIESYDAAGNYTVSYKKPDGTPVTQTITYDELKKANDPHDFNLNGSSFYDAAIKVADQPVLKSFLEGAKPIIDKYLPSDGSLIGLSPEALTKRQKQCVADLMHYTSNVMSYPDEKEAHPDEASTKFWKMIDDAGPWGTVPIGDLLDVGRGVCRHQCIVHQLLMQEAGIDSRIAIGAANTDDAKFRGLHAWTEIGLADNARYLSDQTWSDAAIPLWNGAYDVDQRRKELYDRTSSMDAELVS
ncbi:MAG: transglutaminase domain-containing protein [Myxococcota bacterium]